MRRMLRSGVLVVVLALAAASVGCSRGDDAIVLEAEFTDVLDLVPRAHVRTSDVPIGTVANIELTDDNRAKVTLRVRPGTGLPRDVEAVLRQTSLLGERFVELRAVGGGGALESGTIEQTSVLTDFEDLVDTGTDLLAFVAADRLSAAVQTGAVAFGGRGSTIGSFISDVETFVGTYERGEDELLRLLDGLDALTAALAPEADVHGETLAELARAAIALQEEDDRLLDALTDLTRLADTGERIMVRHRREIDDSIRQLRTILDAINRIDGALQGVLTWLPRHNLHVSNGVFLEHAQVWNDFVLCNDQDTEEQSNDCTPSNPNRSNEAPPGYDERTDACNERHEDCAGRVEGDS